MVSHFVEDGINIAFGILCIVEALSMFIVSHQSVDKLRDDLSLPDLIDLSVDMLLIVENFFC